MEKQMAVTIIHSLVGFLVPLAIISTCAYLIRAKRPREGGLGPCQPAKEVAAGVGKRLLCLLSRLTWRSWSNWGERNLMALTCSSSSGLRSPWAVSTAVSTLSSMPLLAETSKNSFSSLCLLPLPGRLVRRGFSITLSLR